MASNLSSQNVKKGVPRVEFLGYLIDSHSLHPMPSKMEAIKKAPTPTNKTKRQVFLGLLNFYAVFLPHKASVAEPLHRLLDHKTAWKWAAEREANAFAAVKDLLTSNAVLVQYSDRLPLTLACNALPYGIGAILSHWLPNGAEAPIAYFSRTLSAPERTAAR